tara:strand:+ start:824 stop:1873 length:1050 start_codon:yes stop_codon:yes gene_type:complete
MTITNVDICCGLAWGDEAKGKVVTELIKTYNYDWICRWSGGSNAGHTIYFNNIKYNTNVIPSGVFYEKKCYIGPQCFINLEDLDKEMQYIKKNGFNIDKIRVSDRVHIITTEHKTEDVLKYKDSQGSTGKGIAPCSRDKYGRTGVRLMDILETYDFGQLKCFDPKKHIMDEILSGDILCEGAQGIWLDIDSGNYPYVTSSTTLPFSACSLGFAPQKIRHIYGAAKIYDTRVGVDPDFGDDLLKNETLNNIAIIGKEFGTTTGRKRKVNWLNLTKLVEGIKISGTTHVIISKTDILTEIETYKLIEGEIKTFQSLEELTNYIDKTIKQNCEFVETILYSNNPKHINFVNK